MVMAREMRRETVVPPPFSDGKIAMWGNRGFDVSRPAVTANALLDNGLRDHFPDYEASFAHNVAGRGDISIVLKGNRIIDPSNGHEDTFPQQAALKVFYPRPGMDQAHATLRKIFEDEGEILRESSHPHIARFLGRKHLTLPLNQEKQTSFEAIAREYFPETVADFINSPKVNLSPFEIVAMTEQLADAIDYLQATHNRIILDISPDNIGRRRRGNFALTDINLTAPVKESISIGKEKLELAGDYQAPELQMSGREVIATQAIPVYELGMVVNALLGGEIPTNEDIGISSGEMFTPLSNVSTKVNEVLARATRRDSNERFQTVKEFSEELKAAFVQEPTHEPISS